MGPARFLCATLLNSRKKLDQKSEKSIFIGYPDGTKGYKSYSLKSKKFLRSKTVLFHGDEFHNFDLDMTQEKLCTFPNIDDDELILNNNKSDENIIDVNEVNEPNTYGENSVRETYEEKYLNEALKKMDKKRERKPPDRLIEQFNYSSECCMLIESLVVDIDEPKCVTDALNDPDWYEAMNSEMSSLIKNNTWELVTRPCDKNIIGCRWVFKIKRKSDGSVDRYKARLVAQGFSQVYGIDYDEVFSPVARFTAIRSLFAIANIYDLEIHQMDVKTAFLNGELDYELFMEQPEGFVDKSKPEHVCRLKKSLYGLKQSARCWNAMLDEYLQSDGYFKSEADDCIYVKLSENGRSFIILAVYVDDLIHVSNDLIMLNNEKLKLKQKFEMVNNGDISYLLGLVIKRDRPNKMLSISQPKYLENMLKRFRMDTSKSIATPLEVGNKFTKLSENEKPFDVKLYQQAIGCLNYAALTTRPDLSAAVGCLSQYMSAPSEDHWSGIKRILRYIKGTINYGLCFSTDNKNELIGYSDSDWAGDINTRRSTSGYNFFIGNSLVSWLSRKQITVAKSSTEAEYVSLSSTAQEAIWLRRLLNGLKFDIVCPTRIYEDNQGAIELSKNSKHHNRTKHIDISYHFVRERVVSGEIEIMYCPTTEMIADIMTKGLHKESYEKFCELMGVKIV